MLMNWPELKTDSNNLLTIFLLARELPFISSIWNIQHFDGSRLLRIDFFFQIASTIVQRYNYWKSWYILHMY